MPFDKYDPSLVINVPVNNTEVPFMELPNTEYYNLNLSNCIDLNHYLVGIDRYTIFNVNNMNDDFNASYNVIFTGFDRYVPKYTVKNRKFPEWYTQ